ncbi:MAG: hypothetical protein KY467_16670 [Gemmatimonadetes bacterium]|nr:hypothetical protein [Gemmatimonadota bacterium]
MSQGEISESVRSFVAQNIESAELLETLLLVHSGGNRQWTPEEVARTIYTVPAGATRRLEQLVEMRLLSSTGGVNPSYRFAPATAALRAQVDELAAAYRADRVGVINLIYNRAADPLRSFSDAFKLRKD